MNLRTEPATNYQLPTTNYQLPTANYFEYNSTISCSWTGRLICSRVGIEPTLADIAAWSNDSHSGTPRPLTSSSACRIAGLLRLVWRIVTTSPGLTENDGMSTLRPFTVKCPWRTSWRACARDVAKPRR